MHHDMRHAVPYSKKQGVPVRLQSASMPHTVSYHNVFFIRNNVSRWDMLATEKSHDLKNNREPQTSLTKI